MIEDLSPTLLIDEVDTFLSSNDQLRGILNSGYTRKTAFVLRMGNQSSVSSPATRHPLARVRLLHDYLVAQLPKAEW